MLAGLRLFWSHSSGDEELQLACRYATTTFKSLKCLIQERRDDSHILIPTLKNPSRMSVFIQTPLRRSVFT